MATSEEYFNYVMGNISAIGDFTSRKMMGEYCVYFNGKLIGDICDNQFFLKPSPSVLKLMPEAERAYPYEGSKTLMVIVDDLENIALLSEVIHRMYHELPEAKKKKK